MIPNHIIVRFGELTTKGKNRKRKAGRIKRDLKKK